MFSVLNTFSCDGGTIVRCTKLESWMPVFFGRIYVLTSVIQGALNLFLEIIVQADDVIGRLCTQLYFTNFVM